MNIQIARGTQNAHLFANVGRIELEFPGLSHYSPPPPPTMKI